MKVSTKGQVTIPQELRIRCGLEPDTEVVFEATAKGVLIRPVATVSEDIERRLRHSTGSATVPISTDEIIALTRGEDS